MVLVLNLVRAAVLTCVEIPVIKVHSDVQTRFQLQLVYALGSSLVLVDVVVL